MESLVKWGLFAAMGATVVVLCIGLYNLFRNGTASRKRSNKMMRLRIMFQAIAVILLGVIIYMRGG